MFSKKDWKYILLFTGAIMLMIASEYLTPKPIDWTRTYAKADKNPYGNYILYQQLTDLFDDAIEVNRVTAFEAQQAGTWDNYAAIIYIDDRFRPTELETEVLMNWVSGGKKVFIAASQFSEIFADTFGIDISYKGYDQPFTGELETGLELSGINFVNAALKTAEDFYYKRGTTNYYFNEFDESITEVLGTDAEEYVNFIGIKYGLGYFYIHANPLVFTNFNLLLENNYDYVARAFSYLPQEPVIWDEYYKSGRAGARTPLRFVLSQPALKWAWGLTLTTLVVFVFFNIKRKQRIIPIVTPPSNTTLEFVETIGRLYYQNKDHHDLAKKKVIYLKDYIRQHFFMSVNHWNAQEIKLLAAKSGLTEKRIEQLAKLVKACINNEGEFSEDKLMALSQAIDQFKEDTAGI